MPPKGATLVPRPSEAQHSSAAADQQRANSAGLGEFELPKTSLVKLAKGSIPDNVKMQQDVVTALMRSSTVFMNYLSAAAHDQALGRSGKSITASDVLKAIQEMDFGPADALIPLLEQELAAYRANMAAAKARKPPGPGRGNGRRRKSGVDEAGDVSMAGDEGEDGAEDDDDDVEGEGEGEGDGDGDGEGGADEDEVAEDEA
ncbi:hypothetical protein Q5752_006177 [Cryptotrichosporon argae]